MSENKGILGLEFKEFQEKIQDGFLKISVIGLGRIGLPTAVAFARSNLLTTGVDINQEIVESVNNGKLRINDEPGLEEALQKVINNKKFSAKKNIHD